LITICSSAGSDWLPCVRRSNAYAVAEGVKGSSIVCLDMGEWQVPGVNCADAFGGEDRAPAAAGSVAARTPEPKQSLLGLAHTSSGRLPRSSSIGSGACDQQRLRVYSVLPQPLAERAKVWCGALAVGPGWHQTDRGFFDAPGAAAAVLGPEDALAPPQDAAMPPVTLVFAAVEGAKALARARREADVRALAAVLGTTLLATLEAFPGGYLCRQQEGDLKYMLAFPEASAALQWCLLAQEALMYAPWPPALLSLPGLAEVHAPGDGALLFRGPRLKMGVCEGVPQSVEPDHVGRADYHGASVNQAARFMDVAAHGGQVACEEALTCGIFRWGLRGCGMLGRVVGTSGDCVRLAILCGATATVTMQLLHQQEGF
jgi:class 3 adenylate cyclase